MNDATTTAELNAPDDAYVRDDVRNLLTMLESMTETPMHEMPVAEAREAFGAMRYVVDAEPTELAVVRDLTCPGPAGDIKLRYYDAQAKRDTATPVVVFYHGGGFVLGDLESHHPFCTEFAAQTDLPVVAVDYRLAPDAPYPAAPDDCEAATRWVAENGRELGLDIAGLIPCGDSAGGNLAIVTARQMQRKPGATPIVAQVPIYPAVDSAASEGSMAQFGEGYLLTADGMAWFHESYAGTVGEERLDPLHYDVAGSVPTVLVTASLDPLRDQGRAYAAKLVQAGVPTTFLEAEGNIHGFICLRKGIPSGQRDIDQLCGAVRSMVATL